MNRHIFDTETMDVDWQDGPRGHASDATWGPPHENWRHGTGTFVYYRGGRVSIGVLLRGHTGACGRGHRGVRTYMGI